jgi:hypothetical protein
MIEKYYDAEKFFSAKLSLGFGKSKNQRIFAPAKERYHSSVGRAKD